MRIHRPRDRCRHTPPPEPLRHLLHQRHERLLALVQRRSWVTCRRRGCSASIGRWCSRCRTTRGTSPSPSNYRSCCSARSVTSPHRSPPPPPGRCPMARWRARTACCRCRSRGGRSVAEPSQAAPLPGRHRNNTAPARRRARRQRARSGISVGEVAAPHRVQLSALVDQSTCNARRLVRTVVVALFFRAFVFSILYSIAVRDIVRPYIILSRRHDMMLSI